jgi:hypothetical protein
MKGTPFFPAWHARLAPMGRRLVQTLKTVQALTLCQLEDRFAPVLPAHFFPKAPAKANSRDRIFTQPRTFWGFLWQGLTPASSCRKVALQVRALFALHDGPELSKADAAFVRARGRLPAERFPQALAATARAADRQAPGTPFLHGRPVKLVDGAMVSLPDTEENREAYPKSECQQMDSGFPLMRLVVIFSLASGAILSMLQGNLHVAELRLFHLLMDTLQKGDILIADQGFGNYVALTLLQQIGVDFISRSARRADGRRGKRLGPKDWLMEWKKSPRRSAILTPEQWAQLPAVVTVRIVRGSLYQKGFRVKQVTLVTTLLDPVLYPPADILRAYLRRWRLEMCLDDLKTTLGMHRLRCKSPQMVVKEAYTYLIAHNLMRWLMAQAAQEYGVDLERISFKGTVDAFREFSQAMAQARSRRKRQALWAKLLRILARDLLPKRPGRREPRAVKLKQNKYPRLNKPRHQFQDPPKRHERRKKARRLRLGLK